MTPINILVADDNMDDRFLLTQAFDEIGIGNMVKMFNNGVQVFKYLAQQTVANLPGLIVLDDNMPVMNGLQTLKALKQNPAYNSIPVIVLSSIENSEYRRKYIELGAKSFVKKPYSFDDNIAIYLYNLLRFVNSEIDTEMLVSH